jgi:hypothetical protein
MMLIWPKRRGFDMRLKWCLKYVMMLLILAVGVSTVGAQSETPVECNESFTVETSTTSPEVRLELRVSAGTPLDIIVTPVAPSLNVMFIIYDSGYQPIQQVKENPRAGAVEAVRDFIAPSSNPRLKIFGVSQERTFFINDAWSTNHAEAYGAFRIEFSCTLPNDTMTDQSTHPPQPVQLPPNFVGFPGLAPVDFANAARLPLPAGIAMAGAVTPNGGEILGYTLDAAAGDTLDLTFTRLSGNLNLGLAVMSPENQIVFQASLVTSQTLNTRFTLPSTGTYTIGVFRIDLLPPAAPEATAFQLQAALNP